MSNLIKIYPMTSSDNNEPSIFEAIAQAPGALYVDVPGLGFVEVSQDAAADAVLRLNKDRGSDCFMLGKISSSNGLGDAARYIANY